MKACDLTAEFPALGGLPVLVVGAAQDRIARPDLVLTLATGIPDSRLVTFREAAHALPIHDAAAVNEVLARHFEGNADLAS